MTAAELPTQVPPPPEQTALLQNAALETARIVLKRKRLMEQELKDTKHALEVMNLELTRSNLALQQFAYAASHDLQEPLRSVRSSVQLLQLRYGAALDDRAREFIGHAVSGADRMQVLIEDLLAFSRVSAGRHQHTELALADALREACANLATAMADSAAQLTHDALPTLNADRGQMRQLLQNLIGNALKFRGDQPARIHIAAERKGLEWVISVTDHGIGIAQQHFERIFELFKRLHTREEYPGTGIGLALCQKIVERHGGCMWVESEVGKGSTFFFTLPDNLLQKI